MALNLQFLGLEPLRSFDTQYRCFSVSMLPGNEREDVERGGKIIMPASALDVLSTLNIVYPMMFKLTNKQTKRITHCGVLEFTANEGKVYLPYWMMQNLLLEEGELLNVKCVSLPVATYARFQPQSEDFLDITSPKAVLENGLRSFACLTTGDIVAINYNKRMYELCVLETKPGPAVSIIECDMNVEFAPPVGYKKPVQNNKKEDNLEERISELVPAPIGFVPFKGQGVRLDGKNKKDTEENDSPAVKPKYVRGIPDYDYKIGTLIFLKSFKPVDDEDTKNQDQFEAFTGKGFSLRKASRD